MKRLVVWPAIAVIALASVSAFASEGAPKPFAIRGVKGQFWSGTDSYRRALPWMAANRMNFLMLCYTSFAASASDWRSDYTPAEKEQIRELVADAKRQGIEICLSFNPGIWSKPPLAYSSEQDFQIALEKVRQTHALGIRWFALCLDDISLSLQPEDAERFGKLEAAHVYFVNRLWGSMRSLKPRPRLIFCPSAYCDTGPAHVSIEGQMDYIKVVGEKVDKNVMMFWTGREVRSPSITGADARAVSELLGRKPFIWDNYPVSAGVRWRPLAGPLKNRSADLANEVTGYLANPMREWHISAIPLGTTAQYLLDPGGYDPQKAMDNVIRSYPVGQQRAIRLLVDLYGSSFWGEPGFPPKPEPAGKDEARKMLPRYRALRSALLGDQALHPIWEAVKSALEHDILLLERASVDRQTESPLKAYGCDFSGGGADLFGYHFYERHVNYVYARSTGRSEMSVPFYLASVPEAGATLRIAARSQGVEGKISVRITLGDLVLLDGQSPFRDDDFETQRFDVPAASLRTGANLLAIENTEEEGPLGHRPNFMVSEAELVPNPRP